MSNYDHLHSVLVNGVVFKDGKVLVSQRSFKERHMPGWWTIPGGKVEKSKDQVFNILQKELKKEILEETGIEVWEEMELVVNNSFIRESNKQHVVAVVFRCKYKNGIAKPLEDTIDCKWVGIDEVRKMQFPPNVKEYILMAFSWKIDEN